MSEAAGSTGGRARVIIVYRHRLLRDFAVHMLHKAGIEVAAAIAADHLQVQTLAALQPTAIVLDRAASDLLGDLSVATLFSQAPGTAGCVITLDLADSAMVVCRRELVLNAGAENFVAEAADSTGR
jgi:DNA-binding response OmpR family regulator